MLFGVAAADVARGDFNQGRQLLKAASIHVHPFPSLDQQYNTAQAVAAFEGRVSKLGEGSLHLN